MELIRKEREKQLGIKHTKIQRLDLSGFKISKYLTQNKDREIYY